MKKTFFLFSTLTCLLLCNCKSDENPEPLVQPEYSDIDVVTGLDFFDDTGNPIGRWNSPNNNAGAVKIFPIPNIGTVSMYSQGTIIRAWLIPASCLNDTITTNISGLSQNLTFEISAIENAQIKDIPFTDFNTQVNLDFSDVAVGFYRLFYQLDSEEIFWQNLYIDPTVNNIPTFDFLDDLCE